MRAGFLSCAPFQIDRASSYDGSPGRTSSPRNAWASSPSVASPSASWRASVVVMITPPDSSYLSSFRIEYDARKAAFAVT